MATFSTDFSEYSTGSAPSDWTSRWNTDWTLNVESSTARMDSSIGAQVLEIDPGTTDARRLLSWDDIDADANRDDIEFLVRYQLSGYSGTLYYFWLWGRGSGSAGSENGYGLVVRFGNLYLFKYDAGASTVLETANVLHAPEQDDAPYWLRYRINGTTLQAKAWPVSEKEPSNWQIEATDSAISGTGWAGVGNFDDMSTRQVYVDFFEVGTNGDSPSLPSVTTGNMQLDGEHIEVAYNENPDVQINLNGEHIEVAYSGPDVQLNLNGMHVEVAYSINPTELDESPVICINT